MRTLPKLVSTIAVIVLLCGTAITLQLRKTRATAALVDYARATRTRADQGNVAAEATLGHLYYHGQGLPKDDAEAFRWYSKAADQGDAKAQYAVGDMFEFGEGTARNFDQAIRWFRKSADQGNANAECALGSMYYSGRGLPQDRSQAARWFQLAAVRNLPLAQYDLGYVYQRGQGVAQDEVRAREWYRRAADQGNVDAQRVLGLRARRLTPWHATSLAAMFLALLWVLRGSRFLPRPDPPSRQRTALTFVGFAGLVDIAMSLFRATASFSSLFAVNSFLCIQGVIIGLSAAVMSSAFSPRLTRLLRKVSVLLTIGINLIVLILSRSNYSSRIATELLAVDSFLVSLAVSSSLLLRLTRKESPETFSQDLSL